MELLFASILQNALAFFVNGGFFMIILLIVSVVAGTVIVLRSTALREKADPASCARRRDRKSSAG